MMTRKFIGMPTDPGRFSRVCSGVARYLGVLFFWLRLATAIRLLIRILSVLIA
jgi:hypothetical protein